MTVGVVNSIAVVPPEQIEESGLRLLIFSGITLGVGLTVTATFCVTPSAHPAGLTGVI